MDSSVDDLVASLTSGTFVSGDNFSSTSAAGHPHYSTYYKNRGAAADRQAKRREEFLERQKTRRSAAVALVRHLNGEEGGDDSGEDDDTDMDHETTESPSTTAKKRGDVRRGKQKRENPFQNQLMCSEWLVHVPENMADEWILVPCPEGKRALVIANHGSTKAYAKNGRLLREFVSSLPGDFKQTNSRTTVLDCIFCEHKSTFYCLDIICWNGCPVFESDTQFRFFWLKSKLDETPEIRERSNSNRYSFEYISRCVCDRDQMEAMMKEKFPFKLDGLLFYHKDVRYTAGQTPLVGWLKPFMLPEILNVLVPPEYTVGYEGKNSTDFIADFNSEYEKQHSGRQYGGKMKNQPDQRQELEKLEAAIDDGGTNDQ